MLFYSQMLKEKLQQYFNKEIKNYELSLWAKEEYYKLMKGEYIEINKLVVYHFLRKISTFSLVPNDITDDYPCSDEEVEEIKDILNGNKDIHYTFNLKMYKNIFQNELYTMRLEKLKQLNEEIERLALDNKSQISSIVVNNVFKCKSFSFNDSYSLIDLFEENIRSIIAENMDCGEMMLDYRKSVGIYVGRSEKNKKSFVSDLKKLLDCVMGEKSFRVSIAYKKGTPYLSLVLL